MRICRPRAPHDEKRVLPSDEANGLLQVRNGVAFLLLLCALGMHAAAQAPVDKPATADSGVLARPCPAPAANPAHKGKSKAEPVARPGAPFSSCLEVMEPPLEIQEFFQSYVRAERWRFGEEKIVADGWMFTRYLDKNELLLFAKEGIFAERVRWTEGRAFVQITTREIDGGLARVEVTARFQGNGQSVDRFAPPKDTWNLDSTGALEKVLIAALEAHLKSIH